MKRTLIRPGGRPASGRSKRTLSRSDQRGSVMVVVAMSMTALLAMLALGIDLGALFNARSEAQRAADAAALAGASALLEHQDAQATGRSPAASRRGVSRPSCR